MADKNGKQEQERELELNYLTIINQNKIMDHWPNKRVRVIAPDLNGENFASRCDYVTIHGGDGEQLELFVKRVLNNPGVSDMINQLQCFPKEAGFFNSLIPHLVSFIKSRTHNSKENYVLDMLPKCVYATEKIIMMENMVSQGYTILNKLTRQNFEHAKTVMKTLAKFHAPSYLMIKESGKVEDFVSRFPCLQDGFLLEAAEKNVHTWLFSLMSGVKKILDCNGSKESQYGSQMVDKLIPNILFIAQRSFRLEHGHLCHVVNHGDCWNNNMMFLFDGTKIANHVLVDFQELRVGSPSLDILFYFYTSLQHDVRRQEWKNLLQIYYNHLREYCTLLKGHVDFSFEELVADYTKKFISGFIFGTCMTCMFEAMEDFGDLDAVEGSIGEHLHQVVEKWMHQYPEKAALLGQDLSGMFQEFKYFTVGDPLFDI